MGKRKKTAAHYMDRKESFEFLQDKLGEFFFRIGKIETMMKEICLGGSKKTIPLFILSTHKIDELGNHLIDLDNNKTVNANSDAKIVEGNEKNFPKPDMEHLGPPFKLPVYCTQTEYYLHIKPNIIREYKKGKIPIVQYDNDVLIANKENAAKILENIRNDGASEIDLFIWKWRLENIEKYCVDTVYELPAKMVMLGIISVFSEFQIFNEILSITLGKKHNYFSMRSPVGNFNSFNIDITSFSGWDLLSFMYNVRNSIIHKDGVIDETFCSDDSCKECNCDRIKWGEKKYFGTRLNPNYFSWDFYNRFTHEMRSYGKQLTDAIHNAIDAGRVSLEKY